MIKEIKFTDKALKQINNLLSKKDEGSFFRIAIKGGGCSGFQYEFTIDNSKAEDDLNYENILIDKTSADLLRGSEVDYVSELIGSQFKITNPQSKSSCGCGRIRTYTFTLSSLADFLQCLVGVPCDRVGINVSFFLFFAVF